MNDPHNDEGVIAVVMERFETQRLPRLLSIEEKVAQGERLADFDIAYLEEVFTDAQKLKPLLDRHPEYQTLATRVIQLYKQITSRALANENSGS